MYIKSNIETPSCNNCYKGQEVSITYSDCVSVALGIQHAMRMCLWPARLCSIFPRYLINGTIFEK